MADFDAIIVGAGPAGSVAAHALAEAGRSVLVVERGDYAGAKNLTGGRLYSHSLAAIFPDFAETAPVERRITHERISLMTTDANTTIDFTSPQLARPGADSYSVLRGKFDQWLAGQAEQAGAEFIYGIAVENLLRDGARVCGVRAGEDELTAEVVLLCDGVNSLLVPQTGLGDMPQPGQVALGVKETFALPAEAIEDRFMLASGEGAAWLFVGSPSGGRTGGGFLYTNTETLSLGLVITVAELAAGQAPITQLMDDFTSHPAFQPVLKGATMVEYGAHLIPEGGYEAMPKLAGDGCMVVGDSAMMCLNLGYQVRGMDFAIAAGRIAGQVAAQAINAGETSATGLAAYEHRLANSFVLRDLAAYRHVPHFLASTKRVFSDYPRLARDLSLGLFRVDGQPVPHLRKQLVKSAKGVGMLALAKDALRGMRDM